VPSAVPPARSLLVPNSEGGLTITEATRLVGLIQRMLRLAGDIEKRETADREEQEARALGRSVRESMEAYLAEDEGMEARPEGTQTGSPAATRDPSLYFPVDSENAVATDGSGAAPDGGAGAGEASVRPPLTRAA
jgi:hypothetical protein